MDKKDIKVTEQKMKPAQAKFSSFGSFHPYFLGDIPFTFGLFTLSDICHILDWAMQSLIIGFLSLSLHFRPTQVLSKSNVNP